MKSQSDRKCRLCLPGSVYQLQVALMKRTLRSTAQSVMHLNCQWKLGTAAQAARTIVGTSAMVLPAARCALLKLRMSAASWKRAGGGDIPHKNRAAEINRPMRH